MPLEPRVRRSLAPAVSLGKRQAEPIAAATSVRLAALPSQDRPRLGALYRALTERCATLREDLTGGQRGDVDRRFVLARDQLKTLRSCLPDLDPEGTAADLVENRHDVARLREKWSDGDYRVHGRDPVRVRFRCDFEGSVSECCMEFAVLDRVLYNLFDAGYVGARLLEDTFVARFRGPGERRQAA